MADIPNNEYEFFSTGNSDCLEYSDRRDDFPTDEDFASAEVFFVPKQEEEINIDVGAEEDYLHKQQISQDKMVLMGETEPQYFGDLRAPSVISSSKVVSKLVRDAYFKRKAEQDAAAEHERMALMLKAKAAEKAMREMTKSPTPPPPPTPPPEIEITSDSKEHICCELNEAIIEQIIFEENGPDNLGRSQILSIEQIVSKLPWNLTEEQIRRYTSTPTASEHLIVIKYTDGRLRVTARERESNWSYTQRCIACSRIIKKREMYLNFPDCLERRRVWGNALGFKYEQILRVRQTKQISFHPVCTDHFSEECFRTFNFNKAAIEAQGVPLSVDDGEHRLNFSMKPWTCPKCNFKSYSVCSMRNHLIIKHVHGPETLTDFKNGFSCPFCRKCTYSYRTAFGFRKHMMLPPVDHENLRKIYQHSKDCCRSSYLDPHSRWSTWTVHNVCMAYYGFLPEHISQLHDRSQNEVDAVEALLSLSGPLRPDLPSPGLSTAKSPIQTSSPNEIYVIKIDDECEPPVKAVNPSQDNEDTKPDIPNKNLRVSPYRKMLRQKQSMLAKPWREYDEDARLAHRQAASLEARIRLFGDHYSSDVPNGYRRIHTRDGPRIIRSDGDGHT